MQKKEEKIQSNWDIWLRDEVGISASFARIRKLRDLAFIMCPQIYPQFLRLGLSFSEIYSFKKQIQEMLTETHIADPWKEEIVIPIRQHSSQI